MAITKRSALTGQAENKNAGAAAKPAQKAPEVQEKKGLWDTLSRHVMTGISNMIPFLIMGGLILAFSQLIPYVILGVDPSMGIVDAMNSGAYEGFNLSLLKFANLCADFGGTLFGFAIPMFAAFMANSIGGKLAFPAGFIGGLMATKPTAVLSLADGTWTTTAPVASTFLGALIIAIAAGYFVKYLNQKIKVSHNMLAFKSTFLIPMLAALKAIQGNPEQDREMQEIEQNIQELKRQGYRLGRVLTEGSISSAIFIERQNQIEAQLEADRRRLRQLQGQRAFEWEISQTEYLISVFRNRPAILEAYDEELFLLMVDHITVLPGRRLVFRLKNGLELEENEQEVS